MLPNLLYDPNFPSISIAIALVLALIALQLYYCCNFNIFFSWIGFLSLSICLLWPKWSFENLQWILTAFRIKSSSLAETFGTLIAHQPTSLLSIATTLTNVRKLNKLSLCFPSSFWHETFSWQCHCPYCILPKSYQSFKTQLLRHFSKWSPVWTSFSLELPRHF